MPPSAWRATLLEERQVIVVSDGVPSCADGSSDDEIVLQTITAANHERLPINTLLLGRCSAAPR